MEVSMSEEEARKEHDDIVAEIEREKGITKDPEKREDIEEPGDEKEPVEKSKKPLREAPPEDGDKGIDPDSDSRTHQTVPLSKFQDVTKGLKVDISDRDQKLLDKDQQIATLTEALNKEKTVKAMGDKVKVFAEKHGMDEEQVLDLVQLVRGENELDKETKETIQKSAIALKKQEAEDKFQGELEAFITEFPDAAAKERELRTLAFDKSNLDKSLFEIYHRFVKDDVVEKKKTGESSDRTSRTTTQKFDIKKVIEKIESGTPKPFDGLTEAQVDEVFAAMEKTGSRYH